MSSPHFYLISEWSRICLDEPGEGLTPPGQSSLYLPVLDPKALVRIKLSRCCQITQSGGEMSSPLLLYFKEGYSGRSWLGCYGWCWGICHFLPLLFLPAYPTHLQIMGRWLCKRQADPHAMCLDRATANIDMQCSMSSPLLSVQPIALQWRMSSGTFCFILMPTLLLCSSQCLAEI